MNILKKIISMKNKKVYKIIFKKSMERKKLQRARDVNYDIANGKIIIPGLLFNKNNNKFTLKNLNKTGSTLKNLAPKQKNKLKLKIKNRFKKKEKETKKQMKIKTR